MARLGTAQMPRGFQFPWRSLVTLCVLVLVAVAAWHFVPIIAANTITSEPLEVSEIPAPAPPPPVEIAVVEDMPAPTLPPVEKVSPVPAPVEPEPAPAAPTKLHAEWIPTRPDSSSQIDQIAFHPTLPIIYARQGLRSFWQSDEGGVNWKKPNEEELQTMEGLHIPGLRRMSIRPNTEGRVYHAKGASLEQKTVVQQVFDQTKVRPMTNFTVLARAPQNPEIVVAGFMFGPDLAPGELPKVGEHLNATSPPQIYLSMDNQKSWTKVDTLGITEFSSPSVWGVDRIRSLGVRVVNGEILMLVGTNQVWQTTLSADNLPRKPF